MEKDEEFLHAYFVLVSQLCFDKAKEHVEKEKEQQKVYDTVSWLSFLHQLLQLALAEKSYMEIGFLQNKKGFLRKDNSLQAVYETIKFDLKRIEELCKGTSSDKKLQNHCHNVEEFVSARGNLIHFYEQIFTSSTTKPKYNELLQNVEVLTQRCVLNFADISLTPMKAAFSLECAILEQLFQALLELQRLQFLPSLAHIHGAHTRIQAWENTKIKNREVRKLGFIKTTTPALFQWHMNFKAAVLSKFSLFFHDTLASQTAPNEMRQLCTKLQYDFYYKMLQFQKRYDAGAVLLLSDSQVSCDTTAYDCFPVIVSCPSRPPYQVEIILKMIMDGPIDSSLPDNVIYKYSSQEKLTCVYNVVEPNIYIICLFEGKKTEKDSHIGNFITELCINLRCTKVFTSLKSLSK